LADNFAFAEYHSIPMNYRKLNKNDFPAYDALRKEALEKEPEAFGSNEEKEADLRKPRFEAMLNSPSDFIVGAFNENELVGMSGLFQLKGAKVEHKAVIWGVYVQQAHRQQGVGKEVVQTTVDHAWEDETLNVLQLGVSLNNFPAINLYANLGFESYGVEKRALLVNGQYIDEYLMAMVRPGTEDEEEQVGLPG